MSTILASIAIAIKEVKLDLRFKIDFLFKYLTPPVLKGVPLIVIYYGFFYFGGQSIGEGVNKENYVTFIFLGLLVHFFIHYAYVNFAERFMQEKYWNTIASLLIAPIRRSAIILGSGLSILIKLIPTFVIFAGASFLIYPLSPLKFLLVIAILLSSVIIALSLGLIYGSFALANENFNPIFSYGELGIVFLSCFYYPIDVFAKASSFISSFLVPLIKLNPFYSAVTLVRYLWLGGEIVPLYEIYILAAFVVFTPFIALALYTKIWKRLGIQGY